MLSKPLYKGNALLPNVPNFGMIKVFSKRVNKLFWECQIISSVLPLETLKGIQVPYFGAIK